MKKLYLHIGNHKTGTTSIQAALNKYSTLLYEQGYKVFPGNSANLFREEDSFFDEIYSGYGGVIDKSYVSKKFSELSFGDNNVISTEYLSWLFSLQEVCSLKNVLSDFFDEVIMADSIC